MQYELIRKKSPNFSTRPQHTKINTLVIHHTAMTSAEGAVNLLCSPTARVSAHYVIAKDGRVFHLVDEAHTAWHAGKSYWQGKHDLNNNSIGIELDNNGAEPFPSTQMQSLVHLCNGILGRHDIDPTGVVAHADIAPNRKVDPNHNFNWHELCQAGIGRYSIVSVPDNRVLFKYENTSLKISQLKEKLFDFGYYLDISPLYDLQLMNVIHAFKRHYVPESYHNVFWDTLADARLNDLLNLS